jgi:hypothetical protein
MVVRRIDRGAGRRTADRKLISGKRLIGRVEAGIGDVMIFGSLFRSWGRK